MNVKLIGSFYFEPQGYDTINGLYHNIITTEPHPENAKKVNTTAFPANVTDVFQGIYRSVWLEPNNIDNTRLRIERIPNRTYRLLWYTRERVNYEGIGFVSGDKLIGSYWEVSTGRLHITWDLSEQQLIAF